MSDLIQQGPYQHKYTSTGRQSGYQVRLYHSGLDEHKYLSASDLDALKGKVHNQSVTWANKWEKTLGQKSAYARENSANSQTVEAKQRIENLGKILADTLRVNDAINWNALKRNDSFNWNTGDNLNSHKISDTGDKSAAYLSDWNTGDTFINFRVSDGYPESAIFLNDPTKPMEKDYISKIGFLQKLLRQEKKIRAAQTELFNSAAERWKNEIQLTTKNNSQRALDLKRLQQKWMDEEIRFNQSRDAHNQEIDNIKSKYLAGDVQAINRYCEMVLENSKYTENFPKNFVVDYSAQNKILLIDYQLPSLGDLPKIDSVKYIKSRNEVGKKYINETTQSKLYDSVLYQMIIRTLHELFEADTVDFIIAISLNGIVTSINPSSGHEETLCIASIQVKKEEFLKINLSAIDPKQCFKSLKGVGSSKLSGMTAVKPILIMNKEDHRFVQAYEVADSLDETINIAAMDWEDFENLVREIFANEFSTNGGEVKITQASRDGGVDAVAFDPDPIRGGKIAIQAKRYTNTVGVSAVRDLYGTVMNEGATKGILVTTSDYGADSYAFAKDKPLTLLNGAEFLYLLEKHGHKAKININEAKKILKEQAK